MKTTLKRTLAALLAVLVLLPLAGCGQEAQNTPGNAQTNAGEKTPTSGDKSGGGTSTEAKAETNDSTNTSDSTESVETEAPYPVPDYSDFVMPEETGELTVYATDMLGRVMSPAIEIFKENYPGITVNYKVLDGDEFTTLVGTEIPAGRGPDLLFCYRYEIPDPFKAMAAGIFTDLNPYFLSDADFTFDDYLREAMDCGVFRGERLFVPVEVELSVIKSSLEALSDAGIDPDSFTSFESCCANFLKYHEAYPDNALVSIWRGDDYLSLLLRTSGMKFIDYERGTVCVDEGQLHTLLDVCKAYHTEKGHPVGPDYIQIGGLFERMYLGSLGAAPFLLLNDMTVIVRGEGETPFLIPVIDVNGGMTAEIVSYAAIPQGAKNKLNAYRLLRILLSEEIQSGSGRNGQEYLYLGMPVRKASVTDHIRLAIDDYYAGLPHIEEDGQMLADYSLSVTNVSLIPKIIERYLTLEMMPYVRGEKPWDDCYKRFLNTLELYASE